MRHYLKGTWDDMFLMVPGIRATGSANHDQRRVATAREAVEDGSSALVIGRDIREAPDPRAAVEAIRATLSRVVGP